MNIGTLPRHKTARDLALEVIRKAIVEGRLVAGQPLDDQTLAHEMGVSRTPVREAIKILEVQGFVSQRPFSRPTVTPLSAEQVEEVYMIRKPIEGIAAYYACLNIHPTQIGHLKRIVRQEAGAIARGDAVAWTQYNRQFHTRLYAASGKRFLCRYIDWLLDLSMFYMITAAEFLPERIKESNKDHLQIVHACEERKPELAQTLIDKHLQASATLLAHYMRGGNT